MTFSDDGRRVQSKACAAIAPWRDASAPALNSSDCGSVARWRDSKGELRLFFVGLTAKSLPEGAGLLIGSACASDFRSLARRCGSSSRTGLTSEKRRSLARTRKLLVRRSCGDTAAAAFSLVGEIGATAVAELESSLTGC